MDDDLGLEQLKLLKAVFDSVDEDGSGELDIDEFCEQLGPYLGKNLTPQQIAQLFMKIDADAGGTVDWDEFSNYMFLKRAAPEEDVNSWSLVPWEPPPTAATVFSHAKPIERLIFVPEIDKYISCGRDGAFRVWAAADLKHLRVISCSPNWVLDAAYMRRANKLCTIALDRSLTWYDLVRGSYDLLGRLYTTGHMGNPTCLSSMELHGQDRIMYGDSAGTINMIVTDINETFASRDLLYTELTQDYVCLHDQHHGWVNKVRHIEDVGLVSAAADARILVFDVKRDGVMLEVKHHTKSVLDFAYCRTYSLFASCSGRDILMWQAGNTRLAGELSGHAAPVIQLAMDEEQSHLFSLSSDHVIKMWDIRTCRCIQTIARNDWNDPQAATPQAICYNPQRQHLITSTKRLKIWEHKLTLQEQKGHRSPCMDAIYNPNFFVVVSVDDSGCIMSWDIATGERNSRFLDAHDGAAVTTLAFDTNARRMLSGGSDGQVKMWNFNNGSQLRSYVHDDAPQEISKVAYVTDEVREENTVLAVGWNFKVYIWGDDDDVRPHGHP